MTGNKEEWRYVSGTRGRYAVSSLGRVHSFVHGGKGKPIVATPGGSLGYLQFWVYDGLGGKRRAAVHIEVAAAFLGPRPDGKEVCHENGIVSDCRVSNLRYDTHSGNQKDRVDHGTSNRGERGGKAKLTAEQVLRIRSLAAGKTKRVVIATMFGVTVPTVSSIVNRYNWKHI